MIMNSIPKLNDAVKDASHQNGDEKHTCNSPFDKIAPK